MPSIEYHRTRTNAGQPSAGTAERLERFLLVLEPCCLSNVHCRGVVGVPSDASPVRALEYHKGLGHHIVQSLVILIPQHQQQTQV